MHSVDPDAPDLKRLWVDTGEVRYAAMAIGRWAADPPPWAMIACYAEHQRWKRGTSKGYNKEGDGAVLDEIIRVYFRLEDEARVLAGYRPSTYKPPAQNMVVALALLSAEGLLPDERTFRARFKAISTRLMEEEEEQGFPDRASDGARMTKRYKDMLQEWGAKEVGAPTCLHSFVLYLGTLMERE